nr:MAG TPA_asm: hypothetical protein [Caudoviricetes sp.]
MRIKKSTEYIVSRFKLFDEHLLLMLFSRMTQ